MLMLAEPTCCETIFPQVERWLKKSDHREALEWVAARKKRGRYRSTVDFICMELFPEHQRTCWRYYSGKGKLLKETLSKSEINAMQVFMLGALEFAAALLGDGRRISWKQFRLEALGRARSKPAAFGPSDDA
jgi:hypothetical protein